MAILLSHPLIEGRATDPFGWRAAIPGIVGPQLHTGQDWAAPVGTPVRAMHSGRVNRIWWDVMANGDPAGGNMLQIGAARISTRYAHLNGYAVPLGAEVQAGQIVGYVGQTGAATGSHLHGELILNGQFVDPMPYLNATPTPASPPARSQEEELMSAVYARATANSSPLKPGDLATSRIWAGADRVIGGVTYSEVWVIPADGPVRRLTAAEWRIVRLAHEKVGRSVPIADVHGNDIEVLMYGPQAVKK